MLQFKPFLFINLLVVVFVSGCGPQESETIDKPQHVDYLRIPIKKNISTIDPGLTFTNDSVEFIEQLFLGLTDFDPKNNYNVVPELATGWKVSEDGRVYTFKLRQDVKWTPSGEPVTAHDIVWAIQRNLKAETKAPTVNTLYILKNAETIHKAQSEDFTSLGVRAIDDYTIEFTLEHAASYFPALVSLGIYRPLPSQVIEQQGKNWTDPKYIQTNGSYQLFKWEKSDQIILKRNPTYYEANKVNIPEVHYYIIPNGILGLIMYENNELDIMGGEEYLSLPTTEIQRITFHAALRREVFENISFCTVWYGFNTQKPPMDNLFVRKAIAAAIDKQTLNDFIVDGVHSPAITVTRPPIFGSVDPDDPEPVGIPFDPDQAKQWLAEAGYPNGKDFPTNVLFLHHAEPGLKIIAEAIQMMLKHHLNIDIKTGDNGLSFNGYLAAIKQPKTPHIFRMRWCADYPDANNWLYEAFHPEKGYNWIGWKNLEFAKVVENAQQSSDFAERKQFYHRAEQILTEETAAVVPIYFAKRRSLVKPWVKEWYSMPFGGQHIRDWRLEN